MSKICFHFIDDFVAGFMRTDTPLLYERFEYESEYKCGENNVRIRKDETAASSQV